MNKDGIIFIDRGQQSGIKEYHLRVQQELAPLLERLQQLRLAPLLADLWYYVVVFQHVAILGMTFGVSDEALSNLLTRLSTIAVQ